MGRKKKGAELDEKLDKYLSEYELDDLNETNDRQALIQLCRLEVAIDKYTTALNDVDNPLEDSKKIKDLNTSLRDVQNTWIQLQQQLGIDRRKRKSEADESPLLYIARIKQLSKQYIDSRFKVLKCVACSLPVMKYYIYVNESGDRGSIESNSNKPIRVLNHIIKVECPRCGDMVESNQ